MGGRAKQVCAGLARLVRALGTGREWRRVGVCSEWCVLCVAWLLWRRAWGLGAGRRGRPGWLGFLLRTTSTSVASAGELAILGEGMRMRGGGVAAWMRGCVVALRVVVPRVARSPCTQSREERTSGCWSSIPWDRKPSGQSPGRTLPGLRRQLSAGCQLVNQRPGDLGHQVGSGEWGGRLASMG